MGSDDGSGGGDSCSGDEEGRDRWREMFRCGGERGKDVVKDDEREGKSGEGKRGRR